MEMERHTERNSEIHTEGGILGRVVRISYVGMLPSDVTSSLLDPPLKFSIVPEPGG